MDFPSPHLSNSARGGGQLAAAATDYPSN